MAITTLRDLYQAELEDLYDAEQQIVNALPKLQSAANAPDLKAAFEKHLERTKVHIERLDLLFSRLGISRSNVKSTAMQGLIREGEKRMQEAGSDSNTLDAALIAAAQHVEHYEIAGYGCARTFARQIDDDAGADLLQQTLDEEGAADKELTSIAEAGINEAASGGEEFDEGSSSHLRYIDVDDLDKSKHDWSDFNVRNRAGEDLGNVDGVIVDASGRPYYLVIDSGGWFLGNRYIVPVGKVNFDRAARALTVDLDKDTFKRYPEFHSSSFAAMTNEESRRYEWRVLEAIDPNAARQTPGTFEYERYDYYRQPDWLGTDWPGYRRIGRETRTEREPEVVGTSGDVPRHNPDEFDNPDDPLRDRSRR